ncbi:MAG: orotate phosphoribosyltransferase [Gemmatimonadota bacterium]|nr:MAG: orotate phosphoribosyltransferase [Gemmatimonadota bacterium]
MNEHERLIELLAERSFKIGDFTLASGRKSRYYVDARTTTLSAEGQALIGVLGLSALQKAGLSPQAVGGLTMGADPIAYAIAHRSFLDGCVIEAFTVRKEPKGHGAGRQIEGCLEPGQSVVVIEDTITTGGSALKACRAVEAVHARILAILALVDREEGGKETLEEAGYRVISLVRLSELRERVGDRD